MKRLLVNGQPVATEHLPNAVTVRVSEARGDTIMEGDGVTDTLKKLRDTIRVSFKLAGVEAKVEIEET